MPSIWHLRNQLRVQGNAQLGPFSGQPSTGAKILFFIIFYYLFGSGSSAPRIPLPFWRMNVPLGTTALQALPLQLSSHVLEGPTTPSLAAA